MKRGVGVALAAVLAVAVVAAVVLGQKMGGGGGGRDGGGGKATSTALTAVRGVVGSEKEPFFRDPAVKAAFARHGLDVTVQPAGSRDIALMKDLAKNDFAFPSSAPAADRIKRTTKATGTYSPFYSPIAIASYKPIVDVLTRAGVAKKAADGSTRFDMKAYLALTAKGTRWDQLPGNTAYPASKSMLLTTTDVRRSNSAAMYLALASYVANGNKVVTPATAAESVKKTAHLFLDQGYVNGSTEAPFEDYLSLGMGKTPMVVIYESQFLGRQIAKDGSISDDMVLMYPGPDVLCKHTVVAFDDKGDKVGDLLATDPELARLAAKHGFRPQQRALFTETLGKAGVKSPPELVDIIEPPTFETLETLITGIEKQYG